MLTEVESLASALREGPSDERKPKQATRRVLVAAQRATPEECSEAVRRLSSLISLDDSKRGGVAATVCGALVEKRADPTPMQQPLLALLLPVLRKMADEPAPDPVIEPEPEAVAATPIKPQKRAGMLSTIGRLLIASHKFRRAMKQHQREIAAIPVTENEAIVNALRCPTIAIFSASAAARSTQVELRALSKALSGRVELCGWLDSVFDVLDNEPLQVIEPSSPASPVPT